MKKLFFTIFFALQSTEAMAAVAIDKDGLAEMLQNVISKLGPSGTGGPIITFFYIFCVCTGIVCVFFGAKKITEQKGVAGGIVGIIIGSCLVGAPNLIGLYNQTVFGETAATSIMSDAARGSALNATAKTFINFAIMIVQFVGLCAIYTGMRTFYNVAMTETRQPDQTRAAWMYLIFGGLCWNIVFTLKMLAATLGGKALDYYNKVFTSSADQFTIITTFFA